MRALVLTDENKPNYEKQAFVFLCFHPLKPMPSFLIFYYNINSLKLYMILIIMPLEHVVGECT